MITTEVIDGLELCGTLADEWSALDDVGLCEPCTTLEWAHALLATHLRASDTVFAVVLRSAGRAVAIVPALIRTERLAGPIDVDTLYLLCDLTTAHSDILRASDRQDIGAAFISAITRLPYRWDTLRIGRLLDSNPVALQITDCLASSGMAYRVRREQPSFCLDLESSLDEFLAARSGKFRNYLRRKTRQLEAMGRVTVLRAGRDLGMEKAYDDLLSIEQRSWKHAHGTAISAVPHQREFYRLLCEGANRSGRLHLMLMYLDDLPIAFNLGMTSTDRYSYLKTSFDENLRQLSPATVLRARLVETLIAEKIRCLDFPAEPYQWEEQWTNRLRWHVSVLVFNKTPRALLYRLLIGLRSLLKRSRDGDRVHYVDPREHRGA